MLRTVTAERTRQKSARRGCGAVGEPRKGRARRARSTIMARSEDAQGAQSRRSSAPGEAATRRLCAEFCRAALRRGTPSLERQTAQRALRRPIEALVAKAPTPPRKTELRAPLPRWWQSGERAAPKSHDSQRTGARECRVPSAQCLVRRFSHFLTPAGKERDRGAWGRDTWGTDPGGPCSIGGQGCFFYYGRRGRIRKKTRKRQARAEPSGACGRLRVLSPLALEGSWRTPLLPGEKR